MINSLLEIVETQREIGQTCIRQLRASYIFVLYILRDKILVNEFKHALVKPLKQSGNYMYYLLQL
jgi:hypothetical protein